MATRPRLLATPAVLTVQIEPVQSYRVSKTSALVAVKSNFALAAHGAMTAARKQ
jgi:hypothetical protein